MWRYPLCFPGWCLLRLYSLPHLKTTHRQTPQRRSSVLRANTFEKKHGLQNIVLKRKIYVDSGLKVYLCGSDLFGRMILDFNWFSSKRWLDWCGRGWSRDACCGSWEEGDVKGPRVKGEWCVKVGLLLNYREERTPMDPFILIAYCQKLPIYGRYIYISVEKKYICMKVV